MSFWDNFKKSKSVNILLNLKEVKMVWYEKTALVLAAIGAINWGLAELNWNAVDKLIGSWAPAIVVSIVYYVVALCGIWALVKAFK